MQFTRAQATALLNKAEMSLYDDSRANALRQFDEKALQGRISRARTARDRARDLFQRQKLSTRDRTGSKRGVSGSANQRSNEKAELMADIVSRFEARLQQLQPVEAAAGNTSPQRAYVEVPPKTSARRKSLRKSAAHTGRPPVSKTAKPADAPATADKTPRSRHPRVVL
jgi:hypothetical protein